MDEKIIDTRHDIPTPGMYAAVLIALWALCASAGIKLSSESGIQNVGFYGRYDGIDLYGAGFARHITEAISASLPCLGAVIALFILSFSPFLLPAAGIVIGSRGFMLGAAFCHIGDNGVIWHLSIYAVSTFIICWTAAYFLSHRESAVPKIQAFLAASGGCVLCEVLLSYFL